MIIKNANQIQSGEWIKENKGDKFNQVIAVIKDDKEVFMVFSGGYKKETTYKPDDKFFVKE